MFETQLRQPKLPRGSNKGQMATCHPDRKAWCKTLCQTCYVRHRRKLKDRKAECHPDRPHMAKGLCANCYGAHLFKKSSPIARSARWRRAALKYNHGMTEAEYERMLVAQGGLCGMCGTSDPGGRKRNNKFAVDHDHRTGQIRGLLCFNCNTALGFFERHADKAIAYLAKTTKAEVA